MTEKLELKIDLITQGVNILPETKNFLTTTLGEKFYNDDYVTTTGIMLELDENTFVTSGINAKSPYNLIVKDDSLYIEKLSNDNNSTRELIAVKFWAPSKFMIEKTANKFGLITKSVNAHFDRARISPIIGCSFNCSFCSVNEIPYKKISIEELSLALEEALKDKRITHVLISGGSPKLEDLPYLTEVYEYFCKNFPKYKFDVMMTPRGFTSYIDETQYEDYLKHLHNIGVNGLSINIELFDEKICQQYCREKHSIGKARYLKFLKLASKIFGSHNVRSGLIVGLESKESTLEAVKEICECGCLPMLSPYIPYNNIGDYPTTEFLLDVLKQSMEIVKKYNLELAPTCAKCKHNTL